MTPAIVVNRMPAELERVPLVPWKDPSTVSPAELAGYITMLERAVEANPESADLRTCLGMAYAMNYEVYKSMDSLETAVNLAPKHFFAQLKYAELYYRLRALERAEEETVKAVDLSANAWELGVSRRLLLEIRRLRREGTQKPAWTKGLASPAVALAGMFILLSLAFILTR